MAAVSLLSLPPSLSSMSSRRAPLSNNPNAVNSPFRAAVVSTTAPKQKRPYANIQRDEVCGQTPPAKKQMLESHQLVRNSFKQSIQSTNNGPQVSKEKVTHEISLDRRLLSTRDGNQHTSSKMERNIPEELKTIRQWQKHYQRIFPSFVFYFENVAAEAQVKYIKAIMSLGAREEKFFSNTVTHVVTTRSIPPVIDASSAEKKDNSGADLNTQNSRPKTFNPPIFDRSSESLKSQSELGTNKRNPKESTFLKKTSAVFNTGENKRHHCRNADVLHKARELGMKIWSLEKLERIISVIFDIETRYQASHRTSTRIPPASIATSRYGKETDLQQLLRNEKLNGPSDRDLTVSSKDLCLFRGPFICVYDIEEKQKPIMIREYPKVYNKEDGDWPQFRSVANGKCPFIDEVEYSKREAEKEKEDLRLRRQREKEKNLNARNSIPSTNMKPSKHKFIKHTQDDIHGPNRSSKLRSIETKDLNYPTKPSVSVIENPTPRENAFTSRSGIGRVQVGEPIASGIQPTVTSAIRSTMSSVATQPGIKAGTSKEVHNLQRKVLEKKNGEILPPTTTDSQQVLGTRSENQEDSNTEAQGTRIQEFPGPETEKNSTSRENLRKMEEILSRNEVLDCEKTETRSAMLHDWEQSHMSMTKLFHKSKTNKTLRIVPQEPKPGYCENCLDKFEDFEEHIASRKHRKFAEKLENWKLLDKLLLKLARPLRKDVERFS